MAVQIEVDVEDYDDRKIQFKDGGEKMVREQKGYLILDSTKYPQPVKFNIAPGTVYAKGLYDLDDDNFYVDEWGGIKLRKQLKLIAVNH